MSSESNAVLKFVLPGILGVLLGLGTLFVGRYLDSGDTRESDLKASVDRLTANVATLTTDVAVIKAVVVDTQLARRVDSLERELALLREKLPK